MISQVYSLYSFKDFGDPENPVWHVEWPIKHAQIGDLNFHSVTSQVGTILVPVETLGHNEIEVLKNLPPLARQKIVLQLGLHQIDEVDRFSEMGFAIQLWVDRDVEASTALHWNDLIEKVDLVFVPFDRFDVEKSFLNFRNAGFTNFTFLVLQRKNAFSGILNIHSQFELYQRLQLLTVRSALKSAVDLATIQKSSQDLGSFLLAPTYEHYLKHLQEQHISRYWFQGATGFLNRVGLGFIVALLVLILETLKEPFIMHGRVTGFLKRIFSYTHKLRAYPPRITGGAKLVWSYTHQLKAYPPRISGLAKWLWAYTHKLRALPPKVQGLASRILGFLKRLWSYTHKLRAIPPRIHGLWLRVCGFARRVRGWLDHLIGPWLWLKGTTIALFWKLHDWLFPLFKIYYFLKFQFEKRILRKGKN